jgi:hypothetical protein
MWSAENLAVEPRSQIPVMVVDGDSVRRNSVSWDRNIAHECPIAHKANQRDDNFVFPARRNQVQSGYDEVADRDPGQHSVIPGCRQMKEWEVVNDEAEGDENHGSSSCVQE